MTPKEKETIDKMTQMEMARRYRFDAPGSKYFVSGTEINKYFLKVFKEKGGFTPAISKAIGW